MTEMVDSVVIGHASGTLVTEVWISWSDGSILWSIIGGWNALIPQMEVLAKALWAENSCTGNVSPIKTSHWPF